MENVGVLFYNATGKATEILTALKSRNITSEWLPVGNETGNGMLWEDGRVSTNMAQYTTLRNAGQGNQRRKISGFVFLVTGGYNWKIYRFGALINTNLVKT